jgi:hypothetical protein
VLESKPDYVLNHFTLRDALARAFRRFLLQLGKPLIGARAQEHRDFSLSLSRSLGAERAKSFRVWRGVLPLGRPMSLIPMDF